MNIKLLNEDKNGWRAIDRLTYSPPFSIFTLKINGIVAMRNGRRMPVNGISDWQKSARLKIRKFVDKNFID